MRKRKQTATYLILALFPLMLLVQGCSRTTDLEHMANARSFEEQGNYRAAVIEYKSALTRNPENVEARFALGSLYKRLGDVENARKELGIARRSGHRADEATLMLAEIDLDDRKYERLLSEYDPALLASPGDRARLLSMQGLAVLAKGDVREADRHFDAALSQDPGSAYAYYGKARRHMALGRHDLALEAVEKALELDPGMVRARLLEADIAFAQGRTEDAERIFREIIAAEPEKSVTGNTIKAKFGLLQTLLASKRLDEAQEIADHLDRVVSDNPLPKYFKGIIAYQQGRYDVAEENLIRVINVWPSHSQSLLLLGAINFAQGELEQADHYLSNYISAVPANVRARKLLAATRMKLDRPDQAMETLEPVLEQSEQDIRALVMAGSAAVQSGDAALGTSYLEKALEADPEDGRARTELALAYLADDRIDRAIEELKRASRAQDGEEGLRAQVLLSLTYLEKGDMAKALETAQRIKAKHPEEPLAYNLLGVVYDHAGRDFEARMSFEKALEIDAGYVPALINLARLDQKSGHLKEAAGRFEAVLLVDPGNVAVMLELARIADTLGDRAQAVNWLEEAVEADAEALAPRLLLAHHVLSAGRFDEVERHLDKARSIAPDNPGVLMIEAMMEAARQRYDRALALYRKLVERQPDSPVPYYQMALVHLAKGDATNAKKTLERAVDVKGGYVPAATLLARLELAEGNLSKVEGLVDEIKSVDPESITALVMEGDLEMGRGRYDEAIHLYTRALESREHVAVVVKLVAAYLQAGHRDQAIDLMERWVAKHDDSYQVRMRLANLYQSMGRPDEAVEEYEAVLRHYPDDATALNNLAWLYAERNDPRAVETAERALRKAPNNPFILDTYGWALLKQGETKAAVEHLRRAFEGRPDVADIKYHYAVALLEDGRSDEARRLLQELLEDPSGLSSGVDAVRQLLRRL